MFIDNIRTILNPGAKPDYKKKLLQQYADSFKKSSAAISEWTAKADCGAEIQNQAWNLFCEYCRTVLELAISNGTEDVREMENTQALVNGFLSVLFPGKDYADEINSRLNHIAKRAFDAAWSKNPDPYSPMDNMDSFRRMLEFQLERIAEVKRVLWKKEHKNNPGFSLETQMLEIVYDLSRYQPDQREYKQFERLLDSALCILKKNGRNAPGNARPQFNCNSAWEIRAALKDHVQIIRTDPSARQMNLTWEKIRNKKDAICLFQKTQDGHRLSFHFNQK